MFRRRVKFDIEGILRELQQILAVEIVDPNLVCERRRNDLVVLMRLLLKRGYRRLKASDLKVDVRLLSLSFLDESIIPRSRGPNRITVQRVRIAEIKTPKQMAARRSELAQSDPELAEALAPFGLPEEDLHVLVLDGRDTETGERNQRIGQVDRNMLLHGRSVWPVPFGQKPEILSDVYLIAK